MREQRVVRISQTHLFYYAFSQKSRYFYEKVWKNRVKYCIKRVGDSYIIIGILSHTYKCILTCEVPQNCRGFPSCTSTLPSSGEAIVGRGHDHADALQSWCIFKMAQNLSWHFCYSKAKDCYLVGGVITPPYEREDTQKPPYRAIPNGVGQPTSQSHAIVTGHWPELFKDNSKTAHWLF